MVRQVAQQHGAVLPCVVDHIAGASLKTVGFDERDVGVVHALPRADVPGGPHVRIEREHGRQLGDVVAAVDQAHDVGAGEGGHEVGVADARRAECDEQGRRQDGSGQCRERGAEAVAREYQGAAPGRLAFHPLAHLGQRRTRKARMHAPAGFGPAHLVRLQVGREVADLVGLRAAERDHCTAVDVQCGEGEAVRAGIHDEHGRTEAGTRERCGEALAFGLRLLRAAVCESRGLHGPLRRRVALAGLEQRFVAFGR
jgi:hypothetical protein